MTELSIFLLLLLMTGVGLSFLAFKCGYNKGSKDGYKEGMEDSYSTMSNFLKRDLEEYENTNK